MYTNGAERLNIPTIVTGKGGRNIVPLAFHDTVKESHFIRWKMSPSYTQ